jgi:hypothetical protein
MKETVVCMTAQIGVMWLIEGANVCFKFFM